ncbi:MAG: undecaprenyl/decaprenyl-phosphate alpha-N-acetylglucosaminyl 1-phosphate transferase [Planctomycetota bacterium]|jgi:UDP-GlcNAc:undecaprenyl-phosphate GlcNAc-1-phosphate transferase|nr:undecaprenyl/decaprenyl-phosphate alpha-N-acetylglucosaminyl 1-phosphate transferase [Planctomycetota bacterium]
MTFYQICGMLFLVSAAVVYGLSPFCAWLARKIGLVDRPGERKIHADAVPYGGGIAVLAGIFITIGGAYLALGAGFEHLPAAWREFITPYLVGITDRPILRLLAFILGGAIAMFGLGLIDDFCSLSPRVKLGAQILAASAVWYGGVRANVWVDTTWLNFTGTVLWIVLITNAFNLLDNMDGLAAGVALIAGAALFAMMSDRYYFSSALIVTLTGALTGFLPRNFAAPPRKLFLGDAGALFVGFMLATATIIGSYFRDRHDLAHSLLMPVIVLGVPLFDTFSVIIIRLKNRRPLMVGDTNHLSHRLTRRGFTRRQAVATIYLLSLIFGLAAQLLGQLSAGGVVVLFASLFCVVMLMVLLLGRSEDNLQLKINN